MRGRACALSGSEPRTGHDEVLSNDLLLVLVALHADDGPVGRGVGREQDVVLAGDAERDCASTTRSAGYVARS